VGWRPSALPRPALRAAWAGLGRPRLEEMIGPFDLAHALHYSSPLPSHRPVVATVHDLMPVLNPEWHNRAVTWSARRALEVLAGRSEPVIAVSAYVADQLARTGGVDRARIAVVHHGVDERFARPAGPEEQRRLGRRLEGLGVESGRFVLAVGRIGTRKNLVTAVRAMAGTGAAGMPLVLAGREDSGSAAVRAELDRLGLGRRIRLAGFVPDDDLPALVRSARVLVHPAVDEGFGLPPLEAMAAGVPVVAAAAGSLPEVVGDAGLLVEPTDAGAWAEAIEAVTGDDGLAARLADAGRARAAGFTWAQAVRRTREVHFSALAGSGLG
jgi:glycosyltransferase involved in cell wall biosynthesis